MSRTTAIWTVEDTRRFSLIILALVGGCFGPNVDLSEDASPWDEQGTRLVAVGVTGACAIRQVGDFLDAGHDSPMVTNPNFLAYRQPGAPLHPHRLLVGSTSNFGAPLARSGDLEGSMLSVDSTADHVLEVPVDFATDGLQSSALDGAVQRYTGQSPNFLNAIYHPDAATADHTSVGMPLSIGINNAFGRPWFSSATSGANGAGTVTVVDPDGRPFAATISLVAGGVFTGEITNRPPQRIEGALSPATLATIFIGISPDQSIRAVFAALAADGSIAQVHVEEGVDGLAEAGTIAPLSAGLDAWLADPTYAGPQRAGLAFNWIPDRILYATDPMNDAIKALFLTDDGSVFLVDAVDTFTAADFDQPVDLVPTVPELANPDFTSGTTLAGGSDLYILNRGNGSVTRMTQDGEIVDTVLVDLPGMGLLGPDRLCGIAVAGDASRLWVTANGTHPDYPDQEGMVISMDAFGAQSFGGDP